MRRHYAELLSALAAVVLGIVAAISDDAGVELIGLVLGGVALGLALASVCDRPTWEAKPPPRPPLGDRPDA